MTNMHKCPKCGAPNPSRVSICYACNADLAIQQVQAQPVATPMTSQASPGAQAFPSGKSVEAHWRWTIGIIWIVLIFLLLFVWPGPFRYSYIGEQDGYQVRIDRWTGAYYYRSDTPGSPWFDAELKKAREDYEREHPLL